MGHQICLKSCVLERAKIVLLIELRNFYRRNIKNKTVSQLVREQSFPAVTAKKNKWTHVSTPVTVARKYIHNLTKPLQQAFKVQLP